MPHSEDDTQQRATARDGEAPPLDRKLIAITVTVVLGAITTVLDATIVGVAVKTLAARFTSSLTTAQWLTTAYLLSVALVVPLTGWAADRFGAWRVWLAAVSAFTLGSVSCGLAWSMGSLITFRVLQGLGGGMIVPVGMTLVAQAAGQQRVGRAMSIVGAPLVLGPVLGPVIGGVLVTHASWRWIFFVNLPVGVVTLTLSLLVLDRHRPRGVARIDAVGFVLLAPGLALLLYGLATISAVGGNTVAVGCVLAGPVLLAGFVVRALRAEAPLLDLRLFGRPTFRATAAVQFLMGATLNGSMLLFPLFYQLVHDRTPLAAGLLLVPQGVGAAVMMPVAGRIVDRGRAGYVVPAGIGLVVCGLAVYVFAGSDTGYLPLALALWVMGLGAGASMMPAMSAAYRTLSRAAVPRATATFNILQYVGAAMATALYVVLLQNQLAAHPGEPAVAFAGTFWVPLLVATTALLPALALLRAARRPD